MSPTRYAAAAAVAVMATIAPGAAAAQSQPAQSWHYTAEVFGGIGNDRLYQGDSLWGSGLGWSLGAGVRPFSGWAERLGLEVQWTRFDSQRSPSGQVEQTLSATAVAANVAFHFRPDGRLQPFLLGGFGYVSADYTYRCTDCAFRRDPVSGTLVSTGVEQWHEDGGKAGYTWGGGVKIAASRRLSIRPQVLLVNTTPGSGHNWNWIQMDVSAGLRF